MLTIHMTISLKHIASKQNESIDSTKRNNVVENAVACVWIECANVVFIAHVRAEMYFHAKDTIS